MRTTVPIAALVLALVTGCKKEPREAGPASSEAAPAGAAAKDAAAQAGQSFDRLEPKGAPPPPLVKTGGKGDCSTEYAPRPTRDPNPMCKIDGGTFMMGSPEGEGFEDESPPRKVTLSPFYIDQFEVTFGQYAHFLNALGTHLDCPEATESACMRFRQAEHNPIQIVDGRYQVSGVDGRLPAEYVSKQGAEKYCAWVGKRLPTDAEWEYAARHDPRTGKDYRYPWGDDFRAKHATCSEEHCKDGFERTAPVGTFDGTSGLGDGSSPWGLHDTAGNVSEWIGDCWTSTYPHCKGGCVDPKYIDDVCEALQRSDSSNNVTASTLRLANRLRLSGRMAAQWSGLRCARD